MAAAWLLALCLAAAAVVPAHSQEPAPAPAAAPPEFEQILVAGEYRYARSRRAGVHVSFDRGHTWQPRANGLPHRVVYPFPDPPRYAAITSLAADPSNPRRLAATTATGVYLTTDGGMAWRPVATGHMHPHAYFTAVALSPHDPAGLLVGTSFHGIYETADGGATWVHLTPAIRFLADRSLFYEEVAGLSYDPAKPRAMAVLAGFDGGVFYVTDRFAEQRESPGTGLLRFPVPAMDTIQLGFAAAGDGWELHAGTVDATWRLAAGGTWSPIAGAEPVRRGVPLQPPEPAPEQEPEARSPAAATGDAGTSGPPPAGTEAPADATAEPGSKEPTPPAADASRPAAPDSEAADGAATAAGAPEQPQPGAGSTEPAPAPESADRAAKTGTEEPTPSAADASRHTAPDSEAAAAAGVPEHPQPEAGSAEPAPALESAGQEPKLADREPGLPEQEQEPAAGAQHTAVAAAADSGGGAPAAPADPAAQGDRDAVAGIAARLPRVPPPECSTFEHANEDNECSAGQQPRPAADRQPAAPLAAADPSTGQQAAAAANAGRHGDGVAAAPAPSASDGATAGRHGAHLAAALAAARDTPPRAPPPPPPPPPPPGRRPPPPPAPAPAVPTSAARAAP
ncbi:MAG: hypothetical protein OXP69_00980, partial [Spirochaetaceae bacterium]|nr:hypothetical protein [Spirochaetaceae bacterium]